MASVGGVTVEILRGNIAPQTQRVDTWHIPGRTGIGAQLMGLNQSSFSYQCILIAAQASVEGRLASLSALQGTIISVTDDFGETRANLHEIQVAVERYMTDNDTYPWFLLGGDRSGWLNCSS